MSEPTKFLLNLEDLPMLVSRGLDDFSEACPAIKMNREEWGRLKVSILKRLYWKDEQNG